ncbi:MAG: hypothetical protein M9945_13020 [Aquamicrobium sp.]|uniref:hypothetical protein n=1 Tax=Aquamicrobium sp. TaxID=1872579 RepID=UPI00349E7415|nr:hypothetical protein [Aquamicrobium sp.]
MIKFIVAALWISVATTGALLFAFQSSQPEETVEGAEATPFKGLDYVKTGIISVPVFDKGRVHGYFLARLVFVAEGKRLAALKLPAEALLSDHVYDHLFANPEIDFTRRDSFDVDAFRETVRTGVNQRLGEELIREILVEQIDYLPKDEAGSSSVRAPEGAASLPAAH